MADPAHKWTDEEIRKLENRIKREYKKAQKEITEKWNAYMKKGEEDLRDLYNAYVNAPDGKKRAAKKKYQDALRKYTIMNDKFKAMEKETAMRLANVNKTALDLINGSLPPIYTVNYNYMQEDFLSLGISFDLVDESTVRRLLLDGDIKLPKKKLSIPKDVQWNTKQMSSAILQGIIQGESITKIAERLIDIIGNNQKAAIRNARTLATGAENRGRQDRYHSLAKRGIIMYKMWIATPDGRTRDWHLDMDGQEVPENEDFIDGLGNRLEFPGDSSAPPETVYNCRCTMKSVPKGIRGRDGKIHYYKKFDERGLHQQQITEERERRKE